MAGVCKFCGFAGTNDELADHAGECSIMCGDFSPDSEKVQIDQDTNNQNDESINL